jgi:predicted phage terminase large subunit-like protein
MAQIMYNDYRNNGEMEITPDGKHVPDMVLIESKASGDPLIQDLRRAGICATKFNPSQLGDKIKRVQLISHIIEAGRVWVPAKPPKFTQLRDYANTLVELSAIFPNSDSRDVVDTMTQVIHRVLRSGFISHPTDTKGALTIDKVPVLYGINNT